VTRRENNSGGISQRSSDGLWVIQMDVHAPGAAKRKRRTLYAHSITEARAKAKQLRKEIDAGIVATAGMTVETWLRTWLETQVYPRRKPKTAQTYRSAVEQYLIPTLGRIRLDKLTPGHIHAMHAAVLTPGKNGKTRSSTTALGAHSVLRTALQAAVKAELITRNVATLVDAPRLAVSDSTGLSGDDAVALLRAASDDPNASRWWAALLFGARQGECLGLTWDAVDFDAGTVDIRWSLSRVPYQHGCTEPCGLSAQGCPQRTTKIPAGYAYRYLDANHYLLCPKNGKARRLVLISPMRAALQLHAEQTAGQPNPHGLVWHREDGRPIDASADYQAWLVRLAAAGLPKARLHEARHVAASLLLDLGIDARVVQEILGHSTEVQTHSYQRVDRRLMSDALTRLGDRLQLGGGVAR
jgi:integrase